jgi:hypothetical protein
MPACPEADPCQVAELERVRATTDPFRLFSSGLTRIGSAVAQA